ncbi:hypothetical protein LINGRAHAP2_LOCUS33144 [Linum grandiflorum]
MATLSFSLPLSRTTSSLLQSSSKRHQLQLHYPRAKITCSFSVNGAGSESGEPTRIFGWKEVNCVACGVLAALALTASPVIAGAQVDLLFPQLAKDCPFLYLSFQFI